MAHEFIVLDYKKSLYMAIRVLKNVITGVLATQESVEKLHFCFYAKFLNN